MKTIIVSTDFSPIALNATNYALDMAKQIGASIVLLNVYQIPVTINEDASFIVTADVLKANSERDLQQLKDNLIKISGDTVAVSTVSKLGNVSEELELLCEELNPYLVVMGTKGTTGLERVLFGSNTVSAIQSVKWPVLCVPPGKEFGKGLLRVGLATDFKDIAATIPFTVINSLLKDFPATLFVMHVDKNPVSEQLAAEHDLLIKTHLDPDIKAGCFYIEKEDIEDGINEFAENNNLDLIIAIPKKQSFFSRIFNPSSTKQLVLQSYIPVLCIKN